MVENSVDSTCFRRLNFKIFSNHGGTIKSILDVSEDYYLMDPKIYPWPEFDPNPTRNRPEKQPESPEKCVEMCRNALYQVIINNG